MPRGAALERARLARPALARTARQPVNSPVLRPANLLTALLAILLMLPAAASAAPADDALAALREMRLLNYRIQTRYHVATLAAADPGPIANLRADMDRFDSALEKLRNAAAAMPSRGHPTRRPVIPVEPIRDRWQDVRWFVTADPPVPTAEILPPAIAFDRARRPAAIAAMKVAGQQLARALIDGMMAVPAPPEPPANVDFALAALELQYIAYRYVDLAGIDPVLDISGEPALPVLATAFDQRLAQLQSRYGDDPYYDRPMRTLRGAWLFIKPALPTAQNAPVPVLISRYTSLATDALLPIFTLTPAPTDNERSLQKTPELP